jgi:uncharacterized repeat protein (TIGR01451 family)
VKSDGDATYDSVGDVITYTIVATNTGNVTLHNVTITDPNAVLGTCNPAIPVTDLAPGATITCSATHVVTQADLDAGSYLNTACVDDGAGPAAQACDDETTPGIQTPLLTLDKTSDTTLITAVGQVITYSFVVRNTGNITLTGVTLVDNKVDAGTLTCSPTQPTTLAPGQTMNCSGTHAVTQSEFDAGGNLVNTATADSDQTNPGVDDTVSIPIQPPLKGHIMHTGVTCSDFLSEDPSDELERGEYGTKSGKVNNVAPGVMFYYASITAPLADFQINLIQSNDAGWTAMPVAGVNQIILYNANCTKSSVGTSSFNSISGTATINVTGATAGATYVVGIKYSLSGLAGNTVSPPAEIATYDFSMLFGIDPVSGSADSISIFPKP